MENRFFGIPGKAGYAMKYEWPWKRQKITLERDLSVVEKRLAATLKWVEPRPEFLQDLRENLVGQPKRKKISLKIRSWREGLLVAGGVVSIFAMVFNGARIVSTVFGMIQKRQKSVKSPAAA